MARGPVLSAEAAQAKAAELLRKYPGISRRVFIVKLGVSWGRAKQLGIKLPPKSTPVEGRRLKESSNG